MELKKELLSIKLGDLLPSARNVRRHAPGEVQTLAALIASQGPLHPLIVTERLGGRGVIENSWRPKTRMRRGWERSLIENWKSAPRNSWSTT